MKVEKSFFIDCEKVDKVFDGKFLSLYKSDDDQTIYAVANGIVQAKIELIPSCGEGGGGELESISLIG